MSSFAADRTSGSADVALGFLAALERWLALDRSTSPAAFRDGLLGELRRAQAAQASMALVHQLAARALDVAETGVLRHDSVAGLRAHVAASCAAERDDLIAGRAAVARLAVSLLDQRGGWIATLSDSSAVRDAVLAAQAAGRAPRTLIGEGRPRLEGRTLAAAVAAAGVPTWLVVDAALPLLVSQAVAVWLGADAVTDRGVLNKVGSYAVALAAREHGVPVHVLASRRKFLPATTPALRIAEMPPAEVWDEPAPGVQPRNVYFELVPLALVRGVVVEDAVLGPTESATLARERELPEALRAGMA
jgi:translation initiation factor 2B subunit (eIF-2B alpha/beta/delta family)